MKEGPREPQSQIAPPSVPCPDALYELIEKSQRGGQNVWCDFWGGKPSKTQFWTAETAKTAMAACLSHILKGKQRTTKTVMKANDLWLTLPFRHLDTFVKEKERLVGVILDMCHRAFTLATWIATSLHICERIKTWFWRSIAVIKYPRTNLTIQLTNSSSIPSAPKCLPDNFPKQFSRSYNPEINFATHCSGHVRWACEKLLN